MTDFVFRDARAGRPRAAAAPPSANGAEAAFRVAPQEPVPAPDADERERRSHIRRWAALMIVHLERSEHDEARHYGYEEALARLRELIDRELERAGA